MCPALRGDGALLRVMPTAQMLPVMVLFAPTTKLLVSWKKSPPQDPVVPVMVWLSTYGLAQTLKYTPPKMLSVNVFAADRFTLSVME